MDNIINELETRGFVHIPNFLYPNSVSQDLIDYLTYAELNPDGVIYPIPEKLTFNIFNKIKDLNIIADKLNLKISKTNNFVCAIRVNKSTELPIKQKEFNINKDPKLLKGGALNWHIDHLPYYFFKDYNNWLISYIPVFKKDKQTSNLALIPYDVLKNIDINLYNKIKHRGAMRFRIVEEDTIEWFQMRFPNEKTINVGDWFAIEDYYDNENGFKIYIDLEKYKVVPQLNENDLLLVRADVIHKTEDTKSFRLSLRCDLIPTYCPKIGSALHWLYMIIKLPFITRKVRYNYINYMKNKIKSYINFVVVAFL